MNLKNGTRSEFLNQLKVLLSFLFAIKVKFKVLKFEFAKLYVGAESQLSLH